MTLDPDPLATETPIDSPASESQRLMLHMPVDVRSVSLAVLALLASLFALQWAKQVVVPILFGVMMSYALTPIVSRLHRWHIPRAIGATLLLASLLGLMSWGTWALSDQINALVDTMPQVTQKVRQLTRREGNSTSAIEKVQQAAAELESAAVQTSPSSAASSAASSPDATPSTPRKVPPPSTAETRKPASQVDIRGYLLSGTIGALAFLGQVIIVFFIALFLLASGNDFRRKMVKLAGPKLSQKKVTIETLDEITDQIQRYLLVQLGVSVVVGVATGLAFAAIGLNQAAAWGLVAGVTNLIPYVGAALVAAGSAVVGLVQFGSAEMALLVGGISLVIHTLIGNVLTPWWMGRASRMSPFVVFIAVLLFGWLWGTAGLILGVPILLVVKAVCDRIDDLKPVGELLGS